MHLPNTQAKVLPDDALSVVAGIDRDQKLPTFCLDVFSVVCWSMPVRNFGEAMSGWLVAHRRECRPCGHPWRRTGYGCFPRPHRFVAHRQKCCPCRHVGKLTDHREETEDPRTRRLRRFVSSRRKLNQKTQPLTWPVGTDTDLADLPIGLQLPMTPLPQAVEHRGPLNNRSRAYCEPQTPGQGPPK